MKTTLLVFTILSFVFSSRAAPPQSLAADAAVLSSTPGKWQSDVLKITTRDGSVHDEILGIQFAPSARAGQKDAPDSQAKLFISSPTKGVKDLVELSVSLGDGSFQDVHLRENDGVRTITIIRPVPLNDPKPEKTKRIHERYYSVSFPYDLKNNVLTLKGFPTADKVSWGVSEFTVPQSEIRFKVVP